MAAKCQSRRTAAATQQPKGWGIHPMGSAEGTVLKRWSTCFTWHCPDTHTHTRAFHHCFQHQPKWKRCSDLWPIRQQPDSPGVTPKEHFPDSISNLPSYGNQPPTEPTHHPQPHLAGLAPSNTLVPQKQPSIGSPWASSRAGRMPCKLCS